MIHIIIIWLRQKVFCFLGSLTRYIIDKCLRMIGISNKKVAFKKYTDYQMYPENEMIDSILGFIIFSFIISFVINVIRFSS
jgi:hypothetical protein